MKKRTKSKIITFNMATYPERIKYLERAVKSILPLCDKFRIYLNDFIFVPDFLLNNEKIR